MNKKEMIAEIIDLYEENDRLKVAIDSLTQKLDFMSRPVVCDGGPKLTNVEAALIEIGANELVNDAYRYNSISVDRNDETGELYVENYEHWKSCRSIDVPGNIAADDMLAYLEPFIRALYDEKRAKAIADFEAGEADE